MMKMILSACVFSFRFNFYEVCVILCLILKKMKDSSLVFYYKFDASTTNLLVLHHLYFLIQCSKIRCGSSIRMCKHFSFPEFLKCH